MKSRNYQDLIVWQKAIDLVVATYVLTGRFPSSEKYGLISQMRRSAVSIPSNIAEGSKRGTKKDFCQFLNVAFGSGAELETQIEISKRLSFGNEKDYTELAGPLNEVMRMLGKIISGLKETKN
jgi:four helix bundle protein